MIIFLGVDAIISNQSVIQKFIGKSFLLQTSKFHLLTFNFSHHLQCQCECLFSLPFKEKIIFTHSYCFQTMFLKKNQVKLASITLNN